MAAARPRSRASRLFAVECWMPETNLLHYSVNLRVLVLAKAVFHLAFNRKTNSVETKRSIINTRQFHGELPSFLLPLLGCVHFQSHFFNQAIEADFRHLTPSYFKQGPVLTKSLVIPDNTVANPRSLGRSRKIPPSSVLINSAITPELFPITRETKYGTG